MAPLHIMLCDAHTLKAKDISTHASSLSPHHTFPMSGPVKWNPFVSITQHLFLKDFDTLKMIISNRWEIACGLASAGRRGRWGGVAALERVKLRESH